MGRLVLFSAAALCIDQVTLWVASVVPVWLNALALKCTGPLWIAGLLVGFFILPVLWKHSPRGSLWSTAPGRWIIGRFAGSIVVLTQLGAVWVACMSATGSQDAAMVAAVLACIPVYVGLSRVKTMIGRASRPLRRMIRDWRMGMGGAASMAGILEEWSNPWREGQIFLGSSMYDSRWRVGVRDDRHILTVATSRAGKGRDCIIPNLLLWPGASLVIDPKGQNAAVTADARRRKGHTVHIVDPMRDMGDIESARFNPLEGLTPALIDYHERVNLIAEAVIVSSGSGNSAFFDGSARVIVSGLIDTIIRSPAFKPDEKHLGTMREIMILPAGPPTAIMEQLKGMAGAAAALFKRASDKAGGDVFATILEQTKWLDSPVIQHALSASDFNLNDLKNGNTTIYLVVPPQYLDVHSRFLRLFVNLALAAAGDGRKGKHPILFLFDEFYALGRLEMISKASGVIAGSGVKLWPIVQNLGQLQELFPKNWETFLGNAGQWQVFAVNDRTTAEYVSDLLGKRILWKRVVDRDGEEEWEPGRLASLRDPLEFLQSTSRSSGRQMVFTEGGQAFLLNRVHYDDMFNAGEYAVDPMEKAKSRPVWERLKNWLYKIAEIK